MVETQSKILIPTYRFVTSANFAFGLVVIALLLAMILLQSAIAEGNDVQVDSLR